MKRLLLFSISIFLISININSQCTRTGDFQNGGYTVTGVATVEFTLGGSKQLKITNLSTMTGPDLHVYLTNSTSITTSASNTPPVGTIDLGLLSSATGDSDYTIPSDVNLNDYSYVVIQCKEFNAFWGFSELGVQQGANCASLGVEDLDFQSTSFYPNPAIDKISFESLYLNDIEIKIYNSVGALLMANEYVNATRKEILLSNLKTGIYHVELLSGNKRMIKKLVIQ